MASIWRDKDNPIWRAKIRRPNGRCTNRSTKQTDRRKAQKEADFLQEQSDLINRGLTNETRLVKSINAMVAESGFDQIEVVTIADAFEHFLDSTSKSKRASSTVQKYKGILDRFINFLGTERASKSIFALRRTDIEAYKDAELESGKSGSSVDQQVKIISMALSYTKKRGLVTDNVAEGIKLTEEGSETRECFTEEEIKRIYQEADEEWKGMVLLGAWYGMRIGDAANLRWDDIDLLGETIRHTPKKTGRKKKDPALLGMPPEVLAYVRSANHTKKNQYLFPSLGGKKTGSFGGLSNAFGRIMKRAQVVVPKGTTKSGSGRQFSKKGFHSLRHTQISRMAEVGIPPEIGRAISVHSTRDIHQRYVHFTKEIQRSVFSRLGSFLNPKPYDIEYYI